MHVRQHEPTETARYASTLTGDGVDGVRYIHFKCPRCKNVILIGDRKLPDKPPVCDGTTGYRPYTT